MLPKLSFEHTIKSDYHQFLNSLAASSFSGDIEQEYGARLAVSTDNSVYQNLPQGVIFPRGNDDLLVMTKLANQAQFKTITFSARGGGTVSHLTMALLLICRATWTMCLKSTLSRAGLEFKLGWSKISLINF